MAFFSAPEFMEVTKTRKQRAPKSTKAEFASRVSDVYELLLMGGSRPHILQYSAKKWGIADRTADMLIAKATVMLKAELSQDMVITLENHVRRQTQLRFRAYAASRYDLCHQIDQDLARIQSLYPSEKHDLTLHRPRPVAWRPIQDSYRHPAKPPEPAIPATNGNARTNGSHPHGDKPK